MNDIYVTFAACQEVLKTLQIKTTQDFHNDLEMVIKYGHLQTADMRRPAMKQGCVRDFCYVKDPLIS